MFTFELNICDELLNFDKIKSHQEVYDSVKKAQIDSFLFVDKIMEKP